MSANPQNLPKTLLMERQQFPLWLPVFMGIGIAVYFALSFEPWPYSGLVTATLLLVIRVIIWHAGMRIIWVVIFTATTGFAVAQITTENTTVHLLQKRTSFIDIKATVTSVSETQFGLRLILSNIEAGVRAPEEIPNRIRLSIRQKTLPDAYVPIPGQRISVTATLRPPPAPHLPGSYDFQRRAFFQGIGAYGFGIGEIEVLGSSNGSLNARIAQYIHHLRAEIATRARSMATGPPGAVAAALLTGHRGTIPAEILGHMRDSGIAHLLAISGLHIGLAAGTMFVFVRLLILMIPRIGQRLNAKKIASVAAICVAFFYAILAGLTVPTERAFLMTSLMLIGVLIDRRGITLRSVAWAAGIILIFHPSSLLEPGYQMSFAAVICLVSGYEWLSARQKLRSSILIRLWRYVFGVMMTSVIAGAATAPFAIYHFQHVAAFGLIANMIAVPLAAFWVIPAGLISLVLYPIGLDTWPMTLMTTGIGLILDVAEAVSKIPGAAVDIAPMPPWALACIALGALWLCIWRSRIRVLGVLPIIFGVLVGGWDTQQPNIIIDGGGRVVAIHDVNGSMLVSTTNRARFTVDAWRRQSGNNVDAIPWDTTGRAMSQTLRCDIHGCRYIRYGKTISISFDESGLVEDCNKSDIIVALVPIRVSCKKVDRKVDWFDLWRNGTHAIYVTPDKTEIRSVNQVRGDRPWVVKPMPKRTPNQRTVNSSDRGPLGRPGPLLDPGQRYVSRSPYWPAQVRLNHPGGADALTSPRRHPPMPPQ